MANLPQPSVVSSVLDGPPPQPGSQAAPIGGLPGQQLAPPDLPPEVLSGMVQATAKIASMLDSFAQATPDLAADWGSVKDLLQNVTGKLLLKGAAPPATAPGAPFPGGGTDRLSGVGPDSGRR